MGCETLSICLWIFLSRFVSLYSYFPILGSVLFWTHTAWYIFVSFVIVLRSCFLISCIFQSIDLT